MRESDILYECGNAWVCKDKQGYRVYENGATHATSNIIYADLSIAIMDASYKGGSPVRGREAVGIARRILGVR